MVKKVKSIPSKRQAKDGKSGRQEPAPARKKQSVRETISTGVLGYVFRDLRMNLIRTAPFGIDAWLRKRGVSLEFITGDVEQYGNSLELVGQRQPRWSNAFPVEGGYYWFKSKGNEFMVELSGGPFLAHVFVMGETECVTPEVFLKFWGAPWRFYGPLEMPTDDRA